MQSLGLPQLRPLNDLPIALVHRLYLQPILYLIKGLLADNRYASDLEYPRLAAINPMSPEFALEPSSFEFTLT